MASRDSSTHTAMSTLLIPAALMRMTRARRTRPAGARARPANASSFRCCERVVVIL